MQWKGDRTNIWWFMSVPFAMFKWTSKHSKLEVTISVCTDVTFRRHSYDWQLLKMKQVASHRTKRTVHRRPWCLTLTPHRAPSLWRSFHYKAMCSVLVKVTTVPLYICDVEITTFNLISFNFWVYCDLFHQTSHFYLSDNLLLQKACFIFSPLFNPFIPHSQSEQTCL